MKLKRQGAPEQPQDELFEEAKALLLLKCKQQVSPFSKEGFGSLQPSRSTK